MASSQDFVNYICEQARGAGNITYKKMFGEYGVYLDEKIVGLICDNQLFIKITPDTEKLLPECCKGFPYTDAKEHFLIENTDDSAFLTQLLREVYDVLPMPKPKKPRRAKNV